jgi:hypothetical protein
MGTPESLHLKMSAFWPFDADGDAHLGNVAVGTRGGVSTSGFSWWENTHGMDIGGTMGHVFVKNEAHSNEESGIESWVNNKTGLELVNPIIWRNGDFGFQRGGYGGTQRFYNALFSGNGETNVNPTIIRSFVQDSVIEGAGGTPSKGQELQFSNLTQPVEEPHRQIRNTYRNLDVGYTHSHANDCGSVSQSVFPDNPDCSADYSLLMGNKFENVAKPIDFGFQVNANSWHKVANLSDPSLPSNFYITGKNVSSSTPEIEDILKLATGPSFYHAGFDANITPIGPWADYPPVMSPLTVNIGADKMGTITAAATDDKGLAKIEVFVDWKKVGTCAASPCTVKYSFSPSNHPRKYAYVYARAFDNTRISKVREWSTLSGSEEAQGKWVDYNQRAYSDVVELGPEDAVAYAYPYCDAHACRWQSGHAGRGDEPDWVRDRSEQRKTDQAAGRRRPIRHGGSAFPWPQRQLQSQHPGGGRARWTSEA